MKNWIGVHPRGSAADVDRYDILPNRQYILFPYRVIDEIPALLTLDEVKKDYPKTAAYLFENRKRLENREGGKFKIRDWHRFGRSQNIGIQERKKLCVPRLVEQLCASYDSKGSHFLDNVDVGGVTLKVDYSKLNLEFLLCLLNSKLIRWYFPFVSAPFRGGWWSANRQFLSQVPIKVPNLSDPNEKKYHDSAVELVEEMLNFHQRLAGVRTDHEKTVLHRQIETTDRQIDQLVYELYGLTEEEIAIVEDRK